MAVSSPSRLTARLLDPPAGGVWPVRFAVEHLAAIHPKEVAGWLADAYARWGGSDSGAAYLAVAARDCLPAASVTLLRALHDYPRMHWIRVLAVRASGMMDPGGDFVDSRPKCCWIRATRLALVAPPGQRSRRSPMA
jgi:hypothetical protein